MHINWHYILLALWCEEGKQYCILFTKTNDCFETNYLKNIKNVIEIK